MCNNGLSKKCWQLFRIVDPREAVFNTVRSCGTAECYARRRALSSTLRWRGASNYRRRAISRMLPSSRRIRRKPSPVEAWRIVMPHINLPEGLQGIRSAMAFRPETAKPLNELAEALLHAPNSLPQGDRELIATYVSYLNDCYFCQTVHGAIAAAHLDGDEDLVKRVKADFQHADISAKLKALLVVASKVQRGGKHVMAADIEEARRA